jgi:predicted site-specific integrase-resolvase
VPKFGQQEIGPIAVRRWIQQIGISPSTFWRWRQRGWISEPVNIGGRLYLTMEQIAEFKRRAQAGEFAIPSTPPQLITRT